MLEASKLPRVRFEHYDNPKIRWAAVVLELARGGIDLKRASELAEVTAVLASQEVATLDQCLPVLARYERFDEATDHYLVELQRHLSGAGWADRATPMTALNDSFRRRSSGVTELRVWRSLALPEKLLDLVTGAGAGVR